MNLLNKLRGFQPIEDRLAEAIILHVDSELAERIATERRAQELYRVANSLGPDWTPLPHRNPPSTRRRRRRSGKAERMLHPRPRLVTRRR